MLTYDHKMAAERQAKMRKYDARNRFMPRMRVDDIILTDAEKEMAYKDFDIEAYERLNRYWARVDAPRPEPDNTATRIKDDAVRRLMSMLHDTKFDRITIDNIAQMSLYFAGDGRFAGNLTNGLMLRGKVGCGKTTMMRLFVPQFAMMWNCQDIVDNYEMYGLETVQSLKMTATPLCLNDLGTEDKAQRYKSVNLIGSIILARYDNGLLTHYTTNCNDDELRSLYEERIFSRIKGLTNEISWGETGDRRMRNNNL